MDTHNQQQFGSVEQTDNDVEYESGYSWNEWFDFEDTTESEEERIANLEALEDEEADAKELAQRHNSGYVNELFGFVDITESDEEMLANLEAIEDDEADANGLPLMFCDECGVRTEAGCLCSQKTEADTICLLA